MSLTRLEFAGIRELQEDIGAANAEKGFHEALDITGVANIRRYWAEKAALIMTEASEAIEELRDGHEATETYYNESPGKEGKPEGFPSEIADVVIRAFDLADEAGIDLAAAIDEKLRYNTTRAHKHGRTF